MPWDFALAAGSIQIQAVAAVVEAAAKAVPLATIHFVRRSAI
jgi:hypothetical protein